MTLCNEEIFCASQPLTVVNCACPNTNSVILETKHRLCPDVCCTYREQHDGDSQCDSGEDSQADEQQHGVKLVNLGEGVEQLCLHVVCVKGKHRKTI